LPLASIWQAHFVNIIALDTIPKEPHMWILLQLAMAFSADIDQLMHEVKVQGVKVRSQIDRFEKTHTKSCEKIVNRLRYMADAESLGNKMAEQEKRLQEIYAILHVKRSVLEDSKYGLLRDVYMRDKKRYSNISESYHQCLSKWPDIAERREVAGR